MTLTTLAKLAYYFGICGALYAICARNVTWALIAIVVMMVGLIVWEV